MTPEDDRADLRDLFAIQANAVQVPEASRLAEITHDTDPARPGRLKGASRMLLVGAAAAVVVVGLTGIGLWRSTDAPDQQPTADSISDTTAVDKPAVLPPPTNDTTATTSPSTFPTGDSDAENFLITGADNNACVDPDSPYAPAFGDRENLGERSDTIMMWRIDPATSQIAVLSFPRDLWIPIDGQSGQGRINSAYERDNPQKLINTIYNNFGINTDHYIQVDFCAFKTLVDAVDGVSVPFATPVRDANSGLNVPSAGCYTFDGDHALAYVRSRKLESYTPDAGWVTDGTSDLGRISRQQDFMRRTIAQILDKGAFNPDVAAGLMEMMSDYVVTDPSLTPRKLLELAGVLNHIDPDSIATFQIETSGTTIQGNAVLEPMLDGANMQAILAVFRGQATLADAPDPDQETAPTEPPSSTSPPAVVAETINVGITPDVNESCP